MVYITHHSIQRAEQRCIPRPTGRKAILVKLFGRKFGRSMHWLFSGVVYVFSKDGATLITVYPHQQGRAA